MAKSDPEETYSEEETVARREAALKRAFAMPHKPHKAALKKGQNLKTRAAPNEEKAKKS